MAKRGDSQVLLGTKCFLPVALSFSHLEMPLKMGSMGRIKGMEIIMVERSTILDRDGK